MMPKFCLVAAVLFGGATVVGVSQADEAATPPAPTASAEVAINSAEIASNQQQTNQGHASGLMVQARVQSQTSLLSLGGGGTGFLVGYQGPSYSLGLGLGLSRIGVSSGGESASLTVFQVAPTAIIDVWHSADGRAHANLVGSVGYARASVDATTQSTECTGNAAGGETCTTSSQDGSVSASLVPVMLGFGGDYFLSRNFALGAEFGLQALFLVNASSNAGSNTKTVDVGGSAQFGYGALRATFVLGD